MNAGQLIQFLNENGKHEICAESRQYIKHFEAFDLTEAVRGITYGYREWLAFLVEAALNGYAKDQALWDAACASGAAFVETVYEERRRVTDGEQDIMSHGALWFAWREKFWSEFGTQIEAYIERWIAEQKH